MLLNELEHRDMRYTIFNNYKIKIIVIVIAVLVWFFVKLDDNYRYAFKIQLRVTNLGSNRIITNDIPNKVKITCWGKGRYFLSLMIRKDIFYNLDVSRVQKSANFVLDKQQVMLLHENGIEVLNIVEPETVKVIITDLITKKVPITPVVEIQTLPGYTVVDEVQLTPDSVEVMGPKSEIKNISTIYTEKRQYKNVKRDIKNKIRLVNPADPNVKLLSREVTLLVDIQKLMEKAEYEITVDVINQPSNLKVTVIPSTLSLVLEGPTDLLLNVTKQDIKAYIDYKKVQISKNKNHLAYIDTPKGIRYRDVKPKRFKVVVEKIK